MPSITSIRVRLEDTDTMSVVHHGSYLTYFAVAWVEYLRERGFPISEINERIHLPVVEALVRYLKPARNQIVCYRKAGDSYRCYSDGQDIARLALLDRLVQLAPNAPPEYRSLLAPRR